MGRLPAFATIATWLVAALLAVAAGASSIGFVFLQRSPALAVSLWPVNGFALPELVDAATSSSATSVTGNVVAVPAEVAQLARDAISVEPTSAAALRALALHHQGEGRLDRTEALMRLAARLTQRDEIVNLWLVNRDLQSDRLDEALARWDVTLRSIGDRRGYVVTTMAAALADPRLIPSFYRLLRTQPPWAPDFWHAAAQTPPSLDNAARLRTALARAGIGGERERDNLMLTALVERRYFARALDLAEALGQGRGAAGGALTNGDFSRDPAGSPLDWQLPSSGEVGASVDTRASLLEISAAGGARGLVARQLVNLDPGRYRLVVVLGAAAETSPLTVGLTCAEEGSSPGRTFVVDARAAAQEIDLRGARCRHHWVTLSVNATDHPDGIDITVDSVRLTKL